MVMMVDGSQARQKNECRISVVIRLPKGGGGYLDIFTLHAALLCRRPAKHREQGSGLFHTDGFFKTSQSGGGPSTSRQDEASPSFTSVTARRESSLESPPPKPCWLLFRTKQRRGLLHLGRGTGGPGRTRLEGSNARGRANHDRRAGAR